MRVRVNHWPAQHLGVVPRSVFAEHEPMPPEVATHLEPAFSNVVRNLPSMELFHFILEMAPDG